MAVDNLKAELMAAIAKNSQLKVALELDKSVPVQAGNVVRADFDRLGSAGVRFE